MTIEDRILAAIEEARGCRQGDLVVGSEWDEPFFSMGLQGSMSHKVICRDVWDDVWHADHDDDPEEALKDLVANLVARVEMAHEDDQEDE